MDNIVISVEDVMRPFFIQGGPGVTVTNDGRGNVTIRAEVPDEPIIIR